jgi:hypothetical protein
MSVADVQRQIRWARITRALFTTAAVILMVEFAIHVAGGALVLAAMNGFAVVLFAVSIALTTARIRIMRRQERGLREPARPRMTPEDWRRLREMEIGLGWEPSETPADAAEPARPARRTDPPAGCECGHCDGSHEGPAMSWFRDTRPSEPPAPETGSAPMTGPGGRWRPVSELAEHDARAAEAAEHFAALARVGRESCPGFCPICEERWIEKGRWGGDDRDHR